MKEIILSFNRFELKLSEKLFTQVLVKPAFILMIFFGFYSRTEGLLGLSGGQLSVLVSFGFFALSVFHFLFISKKHKVSQFTWLISIFFVLSGVIPLTASFIFGAAPGSVLRFSIEVGITFFMFFSVYYFIKEGVISIKFFLFSLAILGFLASFPLFSNLVGRVNIRRISGLGGSNYLGSSYAIGAISWVFIIFLSTYKEISRRRKFVYYFCFFITLLALILTGTRAAAIAFLIGLACFQLFGMQSKRFMKYFFLCVGVLIALFVYLSFHFDLSLLLDRYSYDQLERMALIRFDIYARSVTDLTLVDFLFGRPDYYLFASGDGGVNPHNVFLAIIRYNGIIPFILFMFIFGLLLYEYFRVYLLHRKNPLFRTAESTIIVLFIMILIYAVFSGGRFTRSFAFYIIMGYAVGYFELLSSMKSYEDYKKLLF